MIKKHWRRERVCRYQSTGSLELYNQCSEGPHMDLR